MDSQIEEIKSKLNVLDVVGSYMKLTKTGINYRGVCPFHKEKSPSFFVNPGRQIWHCFGCGAGSSIFDFVMKIEGVEFGDALRILANKAGIELKRENVQSRTQRQRLYEICELACMFFEKQLESSVAGKEAEEYLLKRGITRDSIKKWRLGYSPDTWNGLSDFLISKNYNREEIVKAGLAIEKPARNASYSDAGGDGKSDSYDRFRGRIIFPVFDLNSQVVGFGGRVFKQANEKDLPVSATTKALQAGTAKYINTPQTLLYDKSGVLYGLNNAKLAVRKQNQCVVTEGYTDVIMCHQAGFENTVAASGTALTSQHLIILKRYSENLVLAFDMDMAGDSATKRGINLAQEQGFNIKVIESYGQDVKEAGSAGSSVLKDGKKSDPADIVLKDAKLWEESVSKARSIMDYYFDSAFLNFDKNIPEGKKEIGNIILPSIKRLPNKIEQSYWIQKLSGDLMIKEEAIISELAKIKVDFHSKEQPAVDFKKNVVQDPISRKRLLEEKVISLILKNPDYIKLIEESQYSLFSEKIRNFLEEIKKVVLNQKPVQEGELEKDFKIIFDQKILNAELKNFLAALTLRAEIDYQEDGQEEILLCLLYLKNIELKHKLDSISEDIKKAEGERDHQKVNNLIGEFNTLTKEL
ncbi:MAG: DNA primase [Candidatus Staskawiczbacteria bacterium RIFCSPHIGHO2_02_FULL_34_10]|uniref:DNA primase n=1 Tax=Candidatus Staskawiczbacteria bacterium RIFCSPHIGHO2_02_FULL_34_10 TaxID=1802205 RepID=A0A1G2HW93_9BACT|nr:MAG: DNA primase [Candidatus Staskawiczbacteria bacterium RIFCSPHIGHO2_02_FULL_34_10]